MGRKACCDEPPNNGLLLASCSLNSLCNTVVHSRKGQQASRPSTLPYLSSRSSWGSNPCALRSASWSSTAVSISLARNFCFLSFFSSLRSVLRNCFSSSDCQRSMKRPAHKLALSFAMAASPVSPLDCRQQGDGSQWGGLWVPTRLFLR